MTVAIVSASFLAGTIMLTSRPPAMGAPVKSGLRLVRRGSVRKGRSQGRAGTRSMASSRRTRVRLVYFTGLATACSSRSRAVIWRPNSPKSLETLKDGTPFWENSVATRASV